MSSVRQRWRTPTHRPARCPRTLLALTLYGTGVEGLAARTHFSRAGPGNGKRKSYERFGGVSRQEARRSLLPASLSGLRAGRRRPARQVINSRMPSRPITVHGADGPPGAGDLPPAAGDSGLGDVVVRRCECRRRRSCQNSSMRNTRQVSSYACSKSIGADASSFSQSGIVPKPQPQ